ncbi:1281_t:CDS:2 [Cetraspora pellucida]|uniref:1281_t:CDS:1 n=1 Tax=Cetraspora pellucida TaxID=1433469 RepID=A0ACA9KG49_9GLOM|nr:1281_t:CDS:2 [Cetraspora pellucida]
MLAHEKAFDKKYKGLEIKIIIKDILEGISEISKISLISDMNLEYKKALASACTKTKEGKINIDDKKIAEALILFVAKELLKATKKKLIKAFEYEKSQFIPKEFLK